LPLDGPDWLKWSSEKNNTLGLAYGLWPKTLNLDINPKPKPKT